MEQAFARKSRFIRKMQFKQCLTPKIKRIILTDNLSEWKKSIGSKSTTCMGSKLRW
jgi:hypothetical protein